MTRNVNGLLVLDKPSGITSREALNEAMKWFPRRTRAGHTGTLDPLATGVLVACLGQATRLAEFVQAMGKCYEARMILGARSTTDDADGEITPTLNPSPVAPETIAEALGAWVGTIDQTPPAYSAVKVGGKRAHALARTGRAVAIEPRAVQIKKIDVLDYAWPHLHLRIRCGKGTYIRSLARDLGEQLGVGAYVGALRRTEVGPFRAADALPLDSSRGQAIQALRPTVEAIAHLPALTLSPEHLDRFCRGQAVPRPPLTADAAETLHSIHDMAGELIGLGEVRPDSMVYPAKIIRPI